MFTSPAQSPGRRADGQADTVGAGSDRRL